MKTGRHYSFMKTGRHYSFMKTGRQHSALKTVGQHSVMKVGRQYSAMKTGRQHSTMRTGRQHSAMKTGRQHSAMKTGRQHSAKDWVIARGTTTVTSRTPSCMLVSNLTVLLLLNCVMAEHELWSCLCPSPHRMMCSSPTSFSLSNQPPCLPASCRVTELTLTGLHLSQSSLTSARLEQLGLCPQAVTSLVLRNSSLGDLRLGRMLANLTTLHLRDNADLQAFSEPGTESIHSLFLSGNYYLQD